MTANFRRVYCYCFSLRGGGGGGGDVGGGDDVSMQYKSQRRRSYRGEEEEEDNVSPVYYTASVHCHNNGWRQRQRQ